jgi:hypothetical protein
MLGFAVIVVVVVVVVAVVSQEVEHISGLHANDEELEPVSQNERCGRNTNSRCVSATTTAGCGSVACLRPSAILATATGATTAKLPTAPCTSRMPSYNASPLVLVDLNCGPAAVTAPWCATAIRNPAAERGRSTKCIAPRAIFRPEAGAPQVAARRHPVAPALSTEQQQRGQQVWFLARSLEAN